MPDDWQFWLEWHKEIAPDNEAEIKAFEADRGNTSAIFGWWAAGEAA
jgi:hypothetical protein